MQMEPWRKRGFVPDSDDEEEEFDSLESRQAIDTTSDKDINLEYLPVPASATTIVSEATPADRIKPASSLSTTDHHDEETPQGSLELVTSPATKQKHTKKPDSPIEGSGKKLKDHRKSGSRSASSDDQTPKPRRTKSYGKRLSGTKKTNQSEDNKQNSPPAMPDKSIWEVPSSPPVMDLSARKSRRRGVDTNTSTTSTPTKAPQNPTVLRPKNRDWQLLADTGGSRSSSPDELNVVEQPITRLRQNNVDTSNQIDIPDEPNTPQKTDTPERTEQAPMEGSEDDSPLSSPPLSIHFPDDETQPRHDVISVDAPDTVTEQVPNAQILQDLLNEMEAAQPRQRRFRERNAIQMHPYALEMAKYQRLMKEGGIKPVRAIIEEQRKRTKEVTDESQENDEFNPDNLRSSPPAEEFLPAERPERHREEERERNININSRPEDLPLKRVHSAKRRRKSHSGAWHDASGGVGSKPRVVIDNSKTSNSRLSEILSAALPELPSSPPDAEGASSAQETPRATEAFRFPLGFIPSQNTTTDTPPADEPEVHELSSANSSEDDSDSSQGSSAAPDETAEEREIRRIQRQTRGVLPASWVRLEARQRLEKQRLAQSNDNAASKRTDGKGVARKIARKPGQTPRTVSLIDFGDSDSSDNESRKVNDQSARQNIVEIRSETLFDHNDGEGIMEDNRIDYMLPTASRKSSRPREKRKSLKRPNSKETLDHIERQAKKARLKRQTRLTNDSYGTRRTKKSSKKRAPRLGILDAPDVASKPQVEQPQFLRIGTRTARLRPDAGRQSPTRKFFKFSSKEDTMDTNQSLREWTGGKIRQSKAVRPRPRPQNKPQKQKPTPLASLFNGPTRARQAMNKTQAPNRTSTLATTQPDVVMLDDEDHTGQEQNSYRQAATPATISPSHIPAAAAAARPQIEKQGHHWIVHRNMQVTSLQRNTARPAYTNPTGPGESQIAAKSAFSRKLTLLNRDYQHQKGSQAFKSSLPLDRFLSHTGPFTQPAPSAPESSTTAHPTASRTQPTEKNRPTRRLKKPTPHRVIIDSDESTGDTIHDLTTTGVADSPPASITHAASSHPSTFNVGGLFNLQPSYPLEFGIVPLREGLFFHESTFIGSGEFSRSLQLKQRNLDHGSKSCTILVDDQRFQWDSWNDIVSSQMGSVFDIMVLELERNISRQQTDPVHSTSLPALVYRSLINYVTDSLSFNDPIDRKEFVHRTMGFVSRLREPMASYTTADEDQQSNLVKLTCYNLVFANQIRQIAEHRFVGVDLGKDIFNLVKAAAMDVLNLVSSKSGISGVRRFLEEIKKPERRDRGIHDELPSATALVVVEQVLRSSERFKGVLADIQCEACTKGLLRQQRDVRSLESAWHNLFVSLPLNEIDHHGIARRDLRFKTIHDNWSLIKRFITPVLHDIEPKSITQPISYNSYCRTLFQRCHRLINVWGWRECKPIMDNLYDFFAPKYWYNLRLEESRGSPNFLDELDKTPSLDIQAGEPCFHTFLKIIASGLRFLASKYDEKKMRGFVWRLLPNNGRVYSKESPLRHDDLDAVRNHHDLLCTLYWAVPDGSRPRIEAIRNLVHPATSHQETCSINLRSWIRLIRFKLSTDEDASSLEQFADWHSHFMVELRMQHSQARSEIEAQNKGDNSVSKELAESLISQNQRQTESLLKMGLSGLRTAVELAPSLEHAYALISKTPFDSIAGLFNPKLPRVNTVVSEALQVVTAYVNKESTPSKAAPAVPAPVDEDSQEFEGFDDWDDVDAVLVQQDVPKEEMEYIQRVLAPTVSRLLSNCFGADDSPEDAILTNVVDSWVSIAYALVRQGLHRWDSYLSQFGDRSWAQLRQTGQTRKYTARFLALCIEKDSQILVESPTLAMGIWMSCLAERSSMLKFQHCLTEAILNGNPNHPLLGNLPFVKDETNDRYHISLPELSQRRVSLLSCILSNMREHVLQLEASESRDLSITKQDYSELLHQLMAAMKFNYRELGDGVAESAQGSYVDFVHRVIRFLQELTSDIRPVDSFFTNPAMFPLPSTDPRYIVAKLKRYEPKLGSNKEINTLMMFLQSIVERATVERQHSHLVDQMHTAMKGTFEAGGHDRPTLRAVLLQCGFPPYLELAFSTPAAWLLSRPIIQTVSLAFKDLFFSMDTNSPACVVSLVEIFRTVFQSCYNALRPLCSNAKRFKEPVVLLMLAEFTKMISSSLVLIDYLDRVTDQVDSLISYIQWFRDLFTVVSSELKNSVPGTESTMNIPIIPAPQNNTSRSETGIPRHLLTFRRAVFEDHQSYLKNWSFHDGKYYYTRSGQGSKMLSLDPEVLLILQNETEAEKLFDDAMIEFSGFIEQLELFPG
ncbi:hypothetical protein N7478_000100 [Penicillium angulare]|uniref:uncharacterized protein n=1 Tax=Penicillium angulare TaxID=116970 RepID=UPI0025410673|nr:uncharacterized protein N7478_000100 [Penicillium angulare]KAJ5290849.1 hypothetical protein N7478_000100 [Penicillium angulare]